MLALKSADLSFALPLTAASYPLAALLARFYLHEHVSLRGLGTLVITIGVAIVVLGGQAGSIGSDRGAAQTAPSACPRGRLDT